MLFWLGRSMALVGIRNRQPYIQVTLACGVTTRSLFVQSCSRVGGWGDAKCFQESCSKQASSMQPTQGR